MIPDRIPAGPNHWPLLVERLKFERAHGVCEYPKCQCRQLLQGHHIWPKARWGIDMPSWLADYITGLHTAGNCFIGCFMHHNHNRYADGTPMSIEDLLILVQRLNKAYGIEGGATK